MSKSISDFAWKTPLLTSSKTNACAGSATYLENQTVAWCLKHTAMTSKIPGREADHRNNGQPKYEKILESPSRQPREERQTGDRGEGLPGWRTRGVVEAWAAKSVSHIYILFYTVKVLEDMVCTLGTSVTWQMNGRFSTLLMEKNPMFPIRGRSW